ncbi:MAG: hypothetical protein WBF17_01970, partial [Phycisphaerae bacterium]
MRRPRSRLSQDRIGYLFASPWLIGFLGLTLLPMIASLLLSFCQWKGLDLSEIEWVGTAHYREALRGIHVGVRRDIEKITRPAEAAVFKDPGDEDVYIALRNTVYYTFLAVPVGLCFSLMLAVLLNQRLRGIGLFRTIFYMP